MKQLIIISNTIILAFMLNSCASSKTEVAPSQNSALNSISKSTAATKKEGAMQKSLDSWLKNDWEPTVSKDKEIQNKYMEKEKVSTTKDANNRQPSQKEETHYVEKKDKPFTLQEYVDKAAAYNKIHPSDYNNSNVKKIESLPVIGK